MEGLELLEAILKALPCPDWKGRQEECVAWAKVLIIRV